MVCSEMEARILPTRRNITAGLITLASTALVSSKGQISAQVGVAAPNPSLPKTVPVKELVLLAETANLRILSDKTDPPNRDLANSSTIKPPLGTARLTPGLAFSGTSPGPIYRIKVGEDASFRLSNRLNEPLSLHWHGLRGANSADGVAGLTGESIIASSEGIIRFRPMDAGMLIYRPMIVGRSAELTDRGLYGAVIVEEANSQPVDMDIVALIDDARIGEDGAHMPFGAATDTAFGGRLGNLLLVDGQPAPLLRRVPPGARVRLRLANVSNARAFRIRFDDIKASVISIDGQPTDSFEPLRASLPLATGSRYEIILELPEETGRTATITGLIGTGLDLIRITTDSAVGSRIKDLAPVTALRGNQLLPGEIKLNLAARADLVLDGGSKPGADGKPVFNGDPSRAWTINGLAGDGRGNGRPLVSVKRGTPVVLSLINRTAWLQTLHLHGHVCRLLHGLDDGWEPYWLDTISVASGQTSRIAFIADNPGRWLIGSTVLERLDTGMSAWFEVS
jgi:FtsP/CotA-like multicopper oxidase with cupredoxin domain